MKYGCTCGGRFKVYSVRSVGCSRIRFLRCKSCGGTTSVCIRVDAKGEELPTIVLRPSTESIDVVQGGDRIGLSEEKSTQR